MAFQENVYLHEAKLRPQSTVPEAASMPTCQAMSMPCPLPHYPIYAHAVNMAHHRQECHSIKVHAHYHPFSVEWPYFAATQANSQVSAAAVPLLGDPSPQRKHTDQDWLGLGRGCDEGAVGTVSLSTSVNFDFLNFLLNSGEGVEGVAGGTGINSGSGSFALRVFLAFLRGSGADRVEGGSSAGGGVVPAMAAAAAAALLLRFCSALYARVRSRAFARDFSAAVCRC